MMKILCKRRYATITELADEFEVSERTIRRDIDVLSLHEPIYTKAGRHAGGVYVVDGYYIDREYFNTAQVDVFAKAIGLLEKTKSPELTEAELRQLKLLLSDYTKPKITTER